MPPLLGLSEAGGVLQASDCFRAAFISPLSGDFFSGLSVAGACYFLLLLLSVAALFLVKRRRWVHVPLVAGFALLSLWNARSIPFFAVVAGPILALNCVDVLVERLGQRTPSVSWQRQLVLVRWLALAGLLLLATASFPGWLQGRPHIERRPGWGLVLDPSLAQTARKIAQWRQQGKLPKDVHWCNTFPDLANYCYFFCPGERMFFDRRIGIFPAATAQEFTDLRRGFSLPKAGELQEAEAPSWRQLFPKRDIRFLLYYEPGNLAPFGGSPGTTNGRCCTSTGGP